MINKNPIFSLIFIIISLSVIISCGPGLYGYGVVLWSPDESQLLTGSVYAIQKKSEIEKNYTLLTADKKTKLELELWRVKEFKKKKDAEQYAAYFAQYALLEGMMMDDRMAVREEMAPKADTIYIARYKEKFKILGRSNEKVEAAGTEDYWWEVLSETGVRGYRFGLNFQVYDVTTVVEEEENAEEMARIRRVLRKTYYSQDVKTMIDNGRIDLDKVKTSYGFFPDPNNKKLKLATPEYSFQLNYESFGFVGKIDGGDRFRFEGAPFQITVINDNKLTLHYTYMDKEYGERYVVISDMSGIIAAEELRREEIYASFFENGPNLVSESYGEITLNEDRSFTWINNRRLAPSVISEDTGKSGNIVLDVFLANALKSKYDGVLRFNFTTGQSKIFLYQKELSGLRLIYAPDNLLDDNAVVREPATPIVIFFSYQSILQ